MDPQSTEKHHSDVAMLILQELKLMRQDMKDEMKKLREMISGNLSSVIGNISKDTENRIELPSSYNFEINSPARPSEFFDPITGNFENALYQNELISEENGFSAVKRNTSPGSTNLSEEIETAVNNAPRMPINPERSLRTFLGNISGTGTTNRFLNQSAFSSRDTNSNSVLQSLPKCASVPRKRKRPLKTSMQKSKTKLQNNLLRMSSKGIVVPVPNSEISTVGSSRTSHEMLSKNGLGISILSVKTNAPQFRCNECNVKCATRYKLTKHKALMHQFTTDFICTQCGKMFYCLTNLKAHKYLHEEKPYICHDCGEKFYTIGAIRKHSRIKCQERLG